MPITPADIHNMAFKKPPIGKRGYDEEEVDALLDEASQELIRLIEENEVLKGRIGREDPGGDQRAEFAELVQRLERMEQARLRAEREAQNMRARLERAQAPATGTDDPRVLMMAQRTADEHVRDARRESDEVMSGALVEAEQITGDARLEAGAIESGAHRDHAAAMDSLAQRRASMLDEIGRLEQLAVGYRSALSGHVTQQLQGVDSASEPHSGQGG